ncbi:MAG: hypothetical protein D6781_01575 [Verrucomicrobia bacterium]|nr:MAG: hypothetical protein D6781_01575 [Verrucomicrobiota bacterium]
MQVFPLSLEEQAAGFSHKVVIKHDDLTETSAGAAQVIQAVGVNPGDLVVACAARVVTAFKDASDAAFNTTAVTVGDGGDPDRFLASQETNANGSTVTAKGGANTTPYAYTAADTIDVTVNSQTGKALANIDTGELHIFLKIIPLASL